MGCDAHSGGSVASKLLLCLNKGPSVGSSQWQQLRSLAASH
jgi:hypothetical protein